MRTTITNKIQMVGLLGAVVLGFFFVGINTARAIPVEYEGVTFEVDENGRFSGGGVTGTIDLNNGRYTIDGEASGSTGETYSVPDGGEVIGPGREDGLNPGGEVINQNTRSLYQLDGGELRANVVGGGSVSTALGETHSFGYDWGMFNAGYQYVAAVNRGDTGAMQSAIDRANQTLQREGGDAGRGITVAVNPNGSISYGCANIQNTTINIPPPPPPSPSPTCANGGITDQRICNPTCANGGLSGPIDCPTGTPTCANGGITDEKICNPTCANGGLSGPKDCPTDTPTCANGGLSGPEDCPETTTTTPTCANGGITDQRICNPTCANGGITDEKICNPTCANGGLSGPINCPSTGTLTCANGGLSGPISCPTCANGGITDEKICNPTCANGGLSGPIYCPFQPPPPPPPCPNCNREASEPEPNPDPVVTVDFQAKPSLVRKNSSSWLYWYVQNVSSCSVRGNKEVLSGNSSGLSGLVGRRTAAITEETSYTLSCVSLPGAAAFTPRTQTILIAPTYNESSHPGVD